MMLGIDFGRVIIGVVKDGPDTNFLGSSLVDAMKTPPSTDAFTCIASLVQLFEGRVWIVSKCGPSVQAKTRAWLDHWSFYYATAVPFGNLEFCRKRHEKAGICQRLGIQYFIDDRVDVLEAMREVVPNLYLFGEQKNPPPDWVVPVLDWAETEKAIRERKI